MLFFIDLIDMLYRIELRGICLISLLLVLLHFRVNLLPCFDLILLVLLDPFGYRVTKSVVNLVVSFNLCLLVLFHLSFHAELHS